MTPPASPALNLDHAEFAAEAPASLPCALCKREIPDVYFALGGAAVCTACRDGVTARAAAARTRTSFLRAAARAGGVALACGVGYAVFVGVTKIQFALITIGIAVLISRSVRRVTQGFGTRRHQVLAVVLTYFAVVLGYAPAVTSGLLHQARTQARQEATHGSHAPPAPGATAARPAAAPAAARPAPHLGILKLLGVLVLFCALIVAVSLAGPFIELTDGGGGLIGFFIVGIALWNAWRLTRGISATFTGPHRVPAGPALPETA